MVIKMSDLNPNDFNLKSLFINIKMNNPLFKMSSVGAQAAQMSGNQLSSIHSTGNNYMGTNIGGMHGNGIGGSVLNQGIGGNAIGHGNNMPPRSQ